MAPPPPHMVAIHEEGVQLPPLAEVIERLGFGAAQLRTGLLGGGIWCACGAQMLLISTCTGAVSEDLGLTSWQRGSLVSVVFIGMFVGNTIGGPLGDGYGRRFPILLAYTGIAGLSVLSALSNSYATLCGLRMLVGVCVGLGQPAFNALLTEVCPAYWRMLMQGACQSLFMVGEIFSVTLIWWDDPYMRHSSWRWLHTMAVLPSIFLGLMAFAFLQQSPHYLAAQGDFKAAKNVLKSMGADNNVPDAWVDFAAAPKRASASGTKSKSMGPFALISSRKYAYSTLVVIYSCFVLNLTLYGTLYGMPLIMGRDRSSQLPALTMLLVALYELPGNMLAVVCGMLLPRKPVIVVYLATVAAALLAMAAGAGSAGGEARWSHVLLQSGFIGIKGFGSIGYVVVYQYATEIYPTVARTTGGAVSMAGGRVGGIIAPLVFEWLLSLTGSFGGFFQLVAALCLLNFFLVVFLPFETFGKTLSEDIDHDDVNADAAYLPLAH